MKPKEHAARQRIPETSHPPIDRRTFVAGSFAAIVGVAAPSAAAAVAAAKPPAGVPSATAAHRRARAFAIRRDAALRELRTPWSAHAANGDLRRYANHIGSFSKGLPHDEHGLVDREAFDALLAALEAGTFASFEAVPLGGSAKLVNPLAAHTYALEGADPQRLGLPAPPAFASAEQAAEMVELYWQALTRDVPFERYATDPLIARAASELSAMRAFSGPRAGGAVTPQTLFRGASKGDLVGPYISQLLVRTVPYGAMSMPQRCRVPMPGIDYMTSLTECVRVANGLPPSGALTFDQVHRYIRNGRDLSEYVHRDYTYQAFLDAAQILLAMGPGVLDRGNPYLRSATQSGFVTYGAPHLLDLVARVANHALMVTWYHKWLVHLRVRPEAFAMHVDNHLAGRGEYPFHDTLLAAPVLEAVHASTGSHLLPVAYPEGSPLHPAYPAGHAAIAGACATVLKAFFDEQAPFPDPRTVSEDGTGLEPYGGGSLKVGGEIDKLASNIAIGRDAAGVHWRSDGIEGIRLGEQVAISILGDLRTTLPEKLGGWSFTSYDGRVLSV